MRVLITISGLQMHVYIVLAPLEASIEIKCGGIIGIYLKRFSK